MDRVGGAGLLVRALWSAGLALGTSTHVMALARAGWRDAYSGMPELTRMYWTSLTVLDPLTALLLFVRPRVGVVATLAIMISNVAHNTWTLVAFGTSWVYLLLQALFLAFVTVTTPIAWSRPAAAAA